MYKLYSTYEFVACTIDKVNTEKIMGREPGYNGGNTEQEQILQKAEEKYGPGAYFVYLRGKNQLVTMTLDQAMAICGEHMASADDLWKTLDKWREVAKRLEAKADGQFEKTIELGKNALRARGIQVGDVSGETQ